jgi:hypothetical protein
MKLQWQVNDYTAQMIVEFFENFDWVAPMELIKADQEKLLTRRL